MGDIFRHFLLQTSVICKVRMSRDFNFFRIVNEKINTDIMEPVLRGGHHYGISSRLDGDHKSGSDEEV